MSDDTKDSGPLNRSEINVNNGFEVRYWAKDLDVSAEQIRSAVGKVGPSMDAIRGELKREGL